MKKRTKAIATRVVTFFMALIVAGTGSCVNLYAADAAPAAQTVRYGDADEDDRITAADALLVLKAVVGIITPDETMQQVMDVEDNGDVTASDALCILKYVVGLIDCFNAELDIPTEQEAFERMYALMDDYPNGTPWTNDNFYAWNGGPSGSGYGCVAFSAMLSDAAFGDLPARKIDDVSFENVHVGDILRLNGDTHSVIVMVVTDFEVLVAEGNFNGGTLWGRNLRISEVEQADYMLTRWPESSVSPRTPNPSCLYDYLRIKDAEFPYDVWYGPDDPLVIDALNELPEIEATAYEGMAALKETYPEGTRLELSDLSWPKARSISHGFALTLLRAAMGWDDGVTAESLPFINNPFEYYYEFYSDKSPNMFGIIPYAYLGQTGVPARELLAGDVIELNDGSYAVVLQVTDDEVILAGTDENGVVYWNRKMSFDEAESYTLYTVYPGAYVGLKDWA